MPGEDSEKFQWKAKYFRKLTSLMEKYPKILLVEADNVGSLQMQRVRIAFRGQAEMIMGKNTMMRKVIRGMLPEHPEFESLLPFIKGNIGFVFCHENFDGAIDIIKKHRVPAAARAGAVAPLDVGVPAGNTGMEPTKTAFFQALNIPTKITKGTIEIISDVQLCFTGVKVGTSEATLLQMLKIFPFSFGLEVFQVYDAGSIFSPSVLDITDDVLISSFCAGVKQVAQLSLGLTYPTLASLPHLISNGYKNVVCISLATDYTFEGTEKMKAFLEDPSAFAVAAPAAGKAAAAPVAAAKAPEPAEESDEDMGFSLFD